MYKTLAIVTVSTNNLGSEYILEERKNGYSIAIYDTIAQTFKRRMHFETKMAAIAQLTGFVGNNLS
jgi:hypothetical protein